MSHHNQRLTVLFDLMKQDVENQLLVGRIQVTGRFIGKDQLRFGDQSPADSDPLLFALREFIRSTLELVLQPHRHSQLLGSFKNFAIQFQSRINKKGYKNVVFRGQIFNQLKLLKNQTYVGDAKITTTGVIKSTNFSFPKLEFVRNPEQKSPPSG